MSGTMDGLIIFVVTVVASFKERDQIQKLDWKEAWKHYLGVSFLIIFVAFFIVISRVAYGR